jgi:5-methylcytosine-specific restriction endonuclease McrA
MNYQRIYDNLISKARERGSLRSSDLYLENHHIIPRCLGGTDEHSNLVMLTAEEHYVAHQLLVKIYPSNNKLTFAVHIMCRASNQKHVRNNKEYGWIRKRFADTMRELHTDRVVSDETKQKMSIAKAGKVLGEKNNFFGKKHDV